MKRRATESDNQLIVKMPVIDKALKKDDKFTAFLTGNGQYSNDNILWPVNYRHDVNEEDTHICFNEMMKPIYIDELKVIIIKSLQFDKHQTFLYTRYS